MSKRRVFSAELKLKTLERLAAGESPSALAKELGVAPQRLHGWRRTYRANDGAFRRRGPPSLADVLEEGLIADDLEAARRRIAELERKVGQQAFDLDFFRGALRRIEASRRPKDGPGVTASSPRSKR
jgi:transposase-like protein